MNKLQRRWRSLFRKRNKPRRSAVAKDINRRPSAVGHDAPRQTGRDAPRQTGRDVPRQTGRDAPRQTGRDVPKQTGRGGADYPWDPAQLAERASKIGKFLHLDPETMLKIPDADKKK